VFTLASVKAHWVEMSPVENQQSGKDFLNRRVLNKE